MFFVFLIFLLELNLLSRQFTTNATINGEITPLVGQNHYGFLPKDLSEDDVISSSTFPWSSPRLKRSGKQRSYDIPPTPSTSKGRAKSKSPQRKANPPPQAKPPPRAILKDQVYKKKDDTGHNVPVKNVNVNVQANKVQFFFRIHLNKLLIFNIYSGNRDPS